MEAVVPKDIREVCSLAPPHDMGGVSHQRCRYGCQPARKQWRVKKLADADGKVVAVVADLDEFVVTIKREFDLRIGTTELGENAR